MVAVVIQAKGYTLQEAADFVGELCRKAIERFDLEKRNLPSWGPERDREVAMYVDGLQNWIVGEFFFSFFYGGCVRLEGYYKDGWG